MRIIKDGKRIEILAPPTPDDKVQSCPSCKFQYESVKFRRASYISCGHFTCLECVKNSKEGCDVCRSSSRIGSSFNGGINSPQGKSCSEVELMPPPPPPPPLLTPSREDDDDDDDEPVVLSVKLAPLKRNRGVIQPQLVLERLTDANIQNSTSGNDKREIDEGDDAGNRISPQLECQNGEIIMKTEPPASADPVLYKCVYCDASYEDRKALGTHYFQEHKDLRPYRCDICGWPLSTKKNLRTHRASHSSEEPFKCSICATSFSQRITLLRHMSVHGVDVTLENIEDNTTSNADITMSPKGPLSSFTPPSQSSPIPVPPDQNGCCSPPLEVTSQYLRAVPIKVEPQDTENSLCRPKPEWKRFPCPHCDKVLALEVTLIVHLRLVHGDIRRHVCKQCGWSFCTLTQLYAHRATHNTKRSYKCTKCGSIFSLKYRLDLHMKIAHDPSKSTRQTVRNISGRKMWRKIPICEYCHETFKQRQLLALHLNKVHADRRPYPCDICMWPFGDRRTLKRHKEVHLGVKRFKCELCNTLFLRKSSKESHVLRIHNVRLRLLPKDKLKKLKYCPECQSKFEDEEGAKHRKVAFAKCGHVYCMDCVIKNEDLGCGQCTTETAPSTTSPSTSPPTLKRKRGRPPNKVKLEVNNEQKKRIIYDPPATRARRRLSLPSTKFGPVTRRSSSSKENSVVDQAVNVRKSGRKVKYQHPANDALQRPSKSSPNPEESPGVEKTRESLNCKHCPATFRYKKCLVSHTNSKHSNLRPHACTMCRWAFQTKKALRRHINTIHGQSKRRKCFDCEKSFLRKGALDRHILKVHPDRRGTKS